MKFFMIFSLDMYALISLIIINNAYHFFKQQEQKEFLSWTVTFLMLISSTSILFAYMKCVNEQGMCLYSGGMPQKSCPTIENIFLVYLVDKGYAIDLVTYSFMMAFWGENSPAVGSKCHRGTSTLWEINFLMKWTWKTLSIGWNIPPLYKHILCS